jgi:hypothetical protein
MPAKDLLPGFRRVQVKIPYLSNAVNRNMGIKVGRHKNGGMKAG